jgi:hypothetical protein
VHGVCCVHRAASRSGPLWVRMWVRPAVAARLAVTRNRGAERRAEAEATPLPQITNADMAVAAGQPIRSERERRPAGSPSTDGRRAVPGPAGHRRRSEAASITHGPIDVFHQRRSPITAPNERRFVVVEGNVEDVLERRAVPGPGQSVNLAAERGRKVRPAHVRGHGRLGRAVPDCDGTENGAAGDEGCG